MQITVVGTGFMGGVLGRALATAGHDVTFGSRRPDSDDVAATTSARAAPVADALASAEVVVLALPGAAVGELAAEHRRELEGKLVIDATNQMGQAVANALRLASREHPLCPGVQHPGRGKRGGAGVRRRAACRHVLFRSRERPFHRGTGHFRRGSATRLRRRGPGGANRCSLRPMGHARVQTGPRPADSPQAPGGLTPVIWHRCPPRRPETASPRPGRIRTGTSAKE